MALQPPPINDVEGTFTFKEWLNTLYKYVSAAAGSIPWASVSKDGSSLADLTTKNHYDLDNISGSSEGYHLSSVNHTDLTDGGESTLHYHASDRSRANHTGTQIASTISDFSEAVDDRVASLLVAGSNISLTYNDTSNTLTITSNGGSVTTPSTVSVGATDLTFDKEIPITINGTTYYILCKSTTSV